MSSRQEPIDENTRRLVVAVTDFLREQLETSEDFVPEDRDCLEIAIQCLEMAYGLDDSGYVQLRFARPLLDIFQQVIHPVTVRDKLRADAHKDEGNSLMRQGMYAEAETEYSNAIELDKWNAIYYCNRASSRIERRNFFEAIADCRQALLINPDYAKSYARMGQAYALINRPREAARCYRQALLLEPENERYRNNLNVAESQITRPDAMELFATMLGSLLGMAPHTVRERERDTNTALPQSFMIITESHPARTSVSRQNQNIPRTGQPEMKTESRTETDTSNNNFEIIFPLPYGIIDEGTVARPLQTDNPDRTTVRNQTCSEDAMIFETDSGDEYFYFDADSDNDFTIPNIPENNDSETVKAQQVDENKVGSLSNEDGKEQPEISSTEQLSKKEIKQSATAPTEIKTESKVIQSSGIENKAPVQLLASDNINQVPSTEPNIPSPLSIEANSKIDPMFSNPCIESKKPAFQQRPQSITTGHRSEIKQLPVSSINKAKLSKDKQLRTIEETTEENTQYPIEKRSSSELIYKMKEGFKSHLKSNMNENSAPDINRVSTPLLTTTMKLPAEVKGNIRNDPTSHISTEDNHEMVVNELLNKVEENLTHSTENLEWDSKAISPVHSKENSESPNNVKVAKQKMPENNMNKAAGSEIKESKNVEKSVAKCSSVKKDKMDGEVNDYTSKKDK